MSFFTNNRTDLVPGPICGNPLNGLCERVCIETNKVFDSCIRQIEERNLELVVVNLTPPAPVQPLTFTGCNSIGAEAEITNLVIERFQETPNFARVSADVNIPIRVTYVDANSVAGEGESVITVTQNVVLYVPQPSIVPFEVKAFANAICANGTYIGDNTFRVDVCITIILKVVAQVDLLIPTYGYCQIPPCQEFVEEICPALFNLPLFPQPEF
jgi:hypothetical protein